MTVIWYILGCLFAAIFGAAAMAFFKIGKRAGIESGIEQEEESPRRMTNAEKLAGELDLMSDNIICNLIPYEHCKKYPHDCERCKVDWLRMEAEK